MALRRNGHRVRRDEAGDIVEGLPFVSDRSLHLARLSAIRRARQALSAAEPAEAAAARPAASRARQNAWKRYRPTRNPD